MSASLEGSGHLKQTIHAVLTTAAAMVSVWNYHTERTASLIAKIEIYKGEMTVTTGPMFSLGMAANAMDTSWGWIVLNVNGGSREQTVIKRILTRKNVKHLTQAELDQFFSAVSNAKIRLSNTKVVTTVSEKMIGRSEVIPFRQMTDFNAYVWLHYYATRDTLLDETTNCTLTGEHGGFCNINDFAHEGPGFPTWHRAYLLIAD